MRGFIHVEIYTDCGGNIIATTTEGFLFSHIKKGGKEVECDMIQFIHVEIYMDYAARMMAMAK